MAVIAPLIAGAAGAAAAYGGAVAVGVTAAATLATAVEVGWTVGSLLYSIYQFANQDVVDIWYL